MEKKVNKHFRSDGNGGHIISKQLFSAIIGLFVTVASVLPVVTYFEGKANAEAKKEVKVENHEVRICTLEKTQDRILDKLETINQNVIDIKEKK